MGGFHFPIRPPPGIARFAMFEIHPAGDRRVLFKLGEQSTVLTPDEAIKAATTILTIAGCRLNFEGAPREIANAKGLI